MSDPSACCEHCECPEGDRVGHFGDTCRYGCNDKPDLRQAVIDAARAVKESDEHGAVAWDDVLQDLFDAVRALDGEGEP